MMFAGLTKTGDKIRDAWRRMSFFRRLLLSGIISFVVIGVFLWLAFNYALTVEIENRASDILRHDLKMAWAYYYERGEQMRLGMEQASVEVDKQLLVKGRNKEKLREFLSAWKTVSPYVDLLLIADTGGQVIARLNDETSGDRVSFNGLLEKALGGEVMLSTELLSPSEMQAEGLAGRVPAIDGVGMALLVAVPVKLGGEVVGAFVAGDLLNGDPYVPSEISEPEEGPYELTKIVPFLPAMVICQGEKVITPPEMSGKDCSLDGSARLREGQFRVAHAYDHGYHIHDAIKDNRGAIVGYLALYFTGGELTDMRGPFALHLLLFIGAGVMLAIFFTFYNARLLSKPVEKLLEAFKVLSSGDLRHRITDTFSGELGQVSQGFNEMVGELESSYKKLSNYGMAIERAGDAIFMCDCEHKVMEVNLAFESMSGYSRGELRGQVLFSTSFGEENRDGIRGIAQGLEGKNSWSGELVLRRKDGRRLDIEVTASRILDGDGECAGYVAICRDLTEKKKMERQLLQADKLSTVGRMAAEIVHDVKNPMNIISLQAQLLAMESDMGKHEEALKSIRAQAERAAGMLDRLKRLSRQERAVRQLHDISSLVEDVLTTLEPLMRSANVRVEKELPQLESPVAVSRERMEQALVNLCMNARDAMREGGVLSVSTGRAEDGKCFIRVADTGSGIADEDLGKIFDPFYTTKPAGMGTGLGLSIVASIMKEHGGEVWVESEMGRGATFTLTLPPVPESALRFEREMGILIGGEKNAEQVYRKLAEMVDVPVQRGLLVSLADDERGHASDLEEIVEQARRGNWSKLPPEMGVNETAFKCPTITPEVGNRKPIAELVVDMETSELNIFHHKLLYQLELEGSIARLLDTHLGKVMDLIYPDEALLNRVREYVGRLKLL